MLKEIKKERRENEFEFYNFLHFLDKYFVTSIIKNIFILLVVIFILAFLHYY